MTITYTIEELKNIIKTLYHIDSYNVKQYEMKRFVDTVRILEPIITRKKFILCYSPLYRANVLIPKKELIKIEIPIESNK